MTLKILAVIAILGAGAYLRWGVRPVGVAYELGKSVERWRHALRPGEFAAVRKQRSISMPPDLDAEIAAAAAQAGMSYSAWLAAAARNEFTIHGRPARPSR